MTEITRNNLEIDEQGFVSGQAFIDIEDDYYVTMTVTSYRFDNDKMNHVPMSMLCEENGRIVHETTDYDSEIPQTAIDNALSSGENLAENYEEFIQ
jgi:hypothetical protein